jgi:predicted DNA-binding protein YlxM (UPF0122 family)
MDPWQKAVHVYQQTLTEKERKLFSDSKAEDILHDVALQEAAQRERSRTRAFGDRIQPLLASIEQYGKALDILPNSSTLILSPLWGSLRILLRVGHSTTG